MRNFKMLLFATALGAATLASGSAQAAINLGAASSIPGKNLLYNDGTRTATTVMGHANQSGTLLSFTAGGAATAASLAISDNIGGLFHFNNNALGYGSNFFGFQGVDGQSIANVVISVAGGGIEDIRQVRVLPVEGGPIPEPAIWALLTIGFGLVGASVRRRRAIVSVND